MNRLSSLDLQSFRRMKKICLFFAFLFFKTYVFSTSYVWNNLLNSTWNTNANWTPNTGFPNGVADVATFNNAITANRVVTLGAPITVNRINFDSNFGFTIAGGANSLTLQASSGNAVIGITHVNGNGADVISANTILNSPLSISHDSTSNFTMSGAISGPGSLTKTGATSSITILSGANTYSGGTFINQGTLRVANDGNLGTSGITFTGISTLAVTSAGTITKNIALNTGALGVISPTGTVTFSGQITGSGDIGITNATVVLTNTTNNYTGNTYFGATVSGTGGNGTLEISNPLQLGATSGIIAWGGSLGTLHVTNDMTIANVPITLTGGGGGLFFNVDAGKTLTYSGGITSLNTATVSIRNGSGTTVLTGDNTNYTQPLIVQAVPSPATQPTLKINNVINLGALTATLRLSGGKLEFGSSVTTPANKNLDISSIPSVPYNPTIINDLGTNNEIQGLIQRTAASSSTPLLTITGPGTLTVSNPVNTYEWGVLVNGNGTLKVPSNGALGLDVVTNPVTLDSGTLEFLQSGGGVSSLFRPLNLNGTGPGTLVIDDATTNEWGGAISGNQNLSITKPTGGLGTGLLKLSGNNSAYSGNTTLSDVTLQITNGNSLGTGNLLFNSGLLELVTGTSQTLTAGITLNGTNNTIQTDAGTSWTLGGVISGGPTNPLTLTGTGLITLGNTNTYSGGTILNGPNLSLTNGSSIGTGDLTLTSGVLEFVSGTETFANAINLNGMNTIQSDAGSDWTVTGLITGGPTNSLTFIGSGRAVLDNVNTYSGGTILNGPTLGLTNASSLGTGPLAITSGVLELVSGNDTFNKAITLNGPSTIQADTGTDWTLSGVISGGASNPLTFTGDGRVVLSNTNTYSGGTILNGPTVGITTASNLGTGQLTMTSGTLELISGTQVFNKSITVNGPSTIQADAGTNWTLSGLISGGAANPLTFTGSGRVVLNNSNTYAGGTVLNGPTLVLTDGSSVGTGLLTMTSGILELLSGTKTLNNAIDLNGPSTIQADAGSNWTLSGLITGGVTDTLTLTGSGKVVLDNANTYTGGTVLNGPTLGLTNGSSVGIGSLTLTSGLLEIVSGTETFNNAIILNGPSTIQSDAGTNWTLSGLISGGLTNSLTFTGSGRVVLDDANTYSGGTILNGPTLGLTNGSSVGTGSLTLTSGLLEIVSGTETFSNAIILNGPSTIQSDTGSDWTLSGLISGGIANPLTFTGTGRVVLDNANTYSGGTTLNGPTLGLTNGSSVGTGSLKLNSGTLEIVSGTETLSNAIVLNGPSTIQSDTGSDWTLSGLISGGAANSLTFTGAGRVVLNNTNTYSGGTILNGPTLGLTNAASIGTGSLTLTSGVLELVNGTVTLNNSISLNGASTIQSDAGTDWTLSGLISGGIANPLTFTGTGRVVLNHANTYAGGTVLNGPTLALANASSLGTGSLNLTSGLLELLSGTRTLSNVIALNGSSTIQADSGANWTLSGLISGGVTNSLTFTGPGRVVLSNANTYSGGTVLNGATLGLTNGSSIGTGQLTLTSGILELVSGTTTLNNAIILNGPSTIQSDAGTNWTLSGLISGGLTNSLTFTGSGRVVLDDANTYSGGTILNGPTLGMTNASSVGTGSLTLTSGILEIVSGTETFSNAIILNGTSTIQSDSGTDWTLSGLVSGGAANALTFTGTGRVVLDNANTYSGGTTLNGPTLGLTNGSSVGTGSLKLNSGILEIVSGTETLSNAIVMNGPSTIQSDAGSDWTLSGLISGGAANPLTFTGTGRVVLDNANTYSGGTILNGPTLGLMNGSSIGTGSLTLTSGILELVSGTTTLNNSISLNGASTIQSDAGTDWTLSGLISGGIANPLTFTGTGRVVLNHANTYAGGTVLNGPTLGLANGSSLGTGSLDLTSGLLELLSGTRTLSNAIALNGSSTIQADSGANWTLSGPISGGVTNSLTFTGPGRVVLSNTNTYSGGTILNGPTLGITNGSSIGTGSLTLTSGIFELVSGMATLNNAIILNGVNTIQADAATNWTLTGLISGGLTNSLTFTGSGRVVLDNANTYSGGTILNGPTLGMTNASSVGTGSLTLTSGILELISGTETFNNAITLNGPSTIQSDTGTDWTLSGLISGGAANSLTFTGNGRVVLDNANTYSGGTNLNGPTLGLMNAASVGTGPIKLTSGILELINGTETLTNAITLNGPSTIQSDTGTDWTLSGLISGGAANPLTFTGNGRVVLDNANTYSGDTVLNGPTLGLTNGSSAGTGIIKLTSGILELVSGTETLSNAISLNGPSTIQSDAGTDWTLSGLISGGAANSLTLTGTGRVVLDHANTYAGGTILNGPTLALANGSAVGTGSLNLTSGLLELSNGVQSMNNSIILNGAGTIQADLGADWTLNGAIVDGGTPSPLTLTGFGRVTLNTINTYSQGTFLDGGTLRISQDQNLGNLASSVTFNGGALELSSSVSTNRSLIFNNDATILATAGISHLNGPLTGPGGLIKGGIGGLSIDGPASYTGNTLVTFGTLFVNSDISSSPLTTVNQGAVLGGNGILAIVDAFGTISPGNSIGTLTVNQLTFEPQSTYFVEVMGNSTDLIIAQDTITILPGSNLVVNPSNIIQEDYTIATATNGIDGTFTNVVNQGIRYMFDVLYPGNEIILHFSGMVPFADFFCGGNLKHIAECLDSFVDNSTLLSTNRLQLTASSDMNDALAVLNSLSIPELVNAFNQLDPGIYQSVSLAELDAANGLLDFYENHTHNDWDYPFISRSCDLNSREFSFWVAPYGLITERKGHHNLRAESSFQNNEATIASGIDFRPLEDLSMTAGVAYSYNDVHWSHANARSSFQSYSAIIGSSYVRSSIALDACIAATYNSGKGKRRIFIEASPLSPELIDPIDYTLKNNNQAYTIASRIGIKCNLCTTTLCDSVLCSIWPFANVDYTFLHQYGYKETGGSIFDLKIHGRNADLLKPEAGIGITLVNPTCDIQYFTDASIAFGREYRTMGRSLTANFKQSSGCSFKVKGLYPQGCYAIPRVSIGARSLIHAIDLSLSYNGAFGSSIQKNELTAQINVGF